MIKWLRNSIYRVFRPKTYNEVVTGIVDEYEKITPDQVVHKYENSRVVIAQCFNRHRTVIGNVDGNGKLSIKRTENEDDCAKS